MRPNLFIEKLKEYPLASHSAWERKKKGQVVIKLDWNEADVGLPAFVRKKVIDFIKSAQTNWYPDTANKTLIRAVAKYSKVPVDYVQYFVGEDSALEYVVRVFATSGDEVGLMSPTYDNFRVFVESVGAKPIYIFTPNMFKPDIDAIGGQITSKTKVVYLVNPNNPTGVLYKPEEIEILSRKFPRIIFLIDEAYFEFTGITVAPLVQRNKNIVVARSFSKAFGLASFRLGYLLASPEIIKNINKIKNSKNVSTLAQLAAISSLKNTAHVQKYVAEVARARKMLCGRLSDMGFDCLVTPANFVLIKTKDSGKFCSLLEKKGIFVRNLNHLPTMQNYVRITVGKVKTMKKFILAIESLPKQLYE